VQSIAIHFKYLNDQNLLQKKSSTLDSNTLELDRAEAETTSRDQKSSTLWRRIRNKQQIQSKHSFSMKNSHSESLKGDDLFSLFD
jgi:hypothetical protein